MGLLDKLWDDTVAGPRPDSGLGRLRKPPALRPKEDLAAAAAVEEVPKVTRSIMIRRPNGCPASPAATPPSSPAGATPLASPLGSTPPVSPFSGGRDWNRYRRKSASDAYDRGVVSVEQNPSSPYEL